jgi:long-chain acyl-CoA synthetase
MPDPATINGLIAATISRHPERPALGFAYGPPLTYARLGEAIRSLAAALTRRGVVRGQTVAILAENSPQWGIAYLAITACGALAVPILPEFPEADIHHILREARIHVLFTSGRLLDKVLEFGSHPLHGVFTLDDSDPEHRHTTATLSELLAQGATLLADPQVACELVTLRPEDTAAIIYTSGTSGHAKAVMLSHANIVATVTAARTILAIPPDATFLSILPLAHTYEFALGFVLPLAAGCRVVYCDKAPTPSVLEGICGHERPHAICAVPMVMEKIHKKRVLPAIQASFWLRQLVRLPWGRRLVMKRIGRRLLAFFGGNLRVMAIGGAALNAETETFLREAGFPFMAGYGLTETAPLLAAGQAGDPTVAFGSVGPPVPGVEIRIDAASAESGIGQIMARGANIMQGYYQNPKLTAEAIDPDGWFNTGDLGFLDPVGNLHIKGRSKSVIVFANGENIYPEAMEERINARPQVVESLVVARDGRLEALVYLDYERVDQEATGREAQRLYVQQLLTDIKSSVNQGVPPYSRLSQIRERTEPFVKTATHKIKRYMYQ